MKERILRIGPHGRLSGILTEPARAPRRAVLLVSAGLVPKAGPYRLYTELARRLAQRDILTLRFDLGGIGDSAKGAGASSLRERTAREVAEAANALREIAKDAPLYLGGLCSGAEDSFRHARVDPNVAGVVLIDPFAFPTAGFQWRHIGHRLARRSLRLLRIYRPSKAAPRPREEDVEAPQIAPASNASLIDYKYMPQEEATKTLETLLDRGSRAHFFYTGGSNESFNHEGQLQKMFPALAFGNQVTIDYLPGMDHTQLLEEDRVELVERIATRLSAE